MGNRWWYLTCVAFAVGAPDARVEAQDRDTVTLSALVLNARTRDGVPGAVLHLSGMAESFTTDESGRVVFEAPLGHYLLTVFSPGYRRLEGDFQVVRDGEFTLSLAPHQVVDPAAPGRLAGTVVDALNGRAIPGAEVRVGGDRRVLTDREGRFVLGELGTGTREVEVRMLGYVVRRESITILPGRTTAVDVVMAADALELDPIEVEVRSLFLETRGVYDRIERGTSGHIVTRREIEVRPGARLSDSMGTIPGLTFQRTGPRSVALGRSRCPMAIYIDGVQMRADINGTVDFDMIPAQWVEAAEVYTGIAGVPIEFSNNWNGCGVVLIWTRER